MSKKGETPESAKTTTNQDANSEDELFGATQNTSSVEDDLVEDINAAESQEEQQTENVEDAGFDLYGGMDEVRSNQNRTLKFGFNEGVVISDFSYGKVGEQADKPPVLQITFQDKFGGQYKEYFWQINPQELIKQYSEMTPWTARKGNPYGLKDGATLKPMHFVQEKARQFNEKVKHVLTTFIDEKTVNEKLAKKTKSYEEFCKNVLEAIGTEWEGIKINLLLEHDSKGRLKLPEYGSFLEKWDKTKPSEIQKRVGKLKRETTTDSNGIPTAGVTGDGASGADLFG